MELSQKNQLSKSVHDLQGDSELNPLLLSLKEKGLKNLLGLAPTKGATDNAFLQNVFGGKK